MPLKSLLGALTFVVMFASTSAARADWREAILGNRITEPSSNWFSSSSKAKAPAKSKSASYQQAAAKPKPVKVASLGSGSSGGWSFWSPSSAPAQPGYAAPKKAAKPSTQSASSGFSFGGGGPTTSGQASYYWQPQQLASGGTFNPNAMTAAHKTLPFGTKVRVTNERNGQSVVVTINDRGPYVAGRIIDLSAGAAGVIGMKQAGVVPVKVAVLGK
jgi:rare lipoprotein A (peptidoglycan hydrolase)